MIYSRLSIPSVRMLDDLPQVLAFDVVDTGSLDVKLVLGRWGVVAPMLSWITKEVTL